MKIYLVFDIIEGRHFMEVFANRDDAHSYAVAQFQRIHSGNMEYFNTFYEIEEREVK